VAFKISSFKENREMTIAILGAGLAGCTLGQQLQAGGRDFFILEKESQLGGLCRTLRTERHYWDLGVHAMYSRQQEINDYYACLPLELETLERNVKVFHQGRSGSRCVVPYPFENGIVDLPFSDRMECLAGFFPVLFKRKMPPSNLEEWIDGRVGAGVAKHFMRPYNRKIWSCELSEISTRLVNERIEPLSTKEILQVLIGRRMVGRAYQAKFRYPKGGIQMFIDHLARDFRNRIFLNSTVKALSRQGKRWIVATTDRRTFVADKVVSTIPLVELLKVVDLPGLAKRYAGLKWNNTFFVMLALKEGCRLNLIEDCHWVFFKGQEIFYRMTLMHNFSPQNSPVIVAEITAKDDLRERDQDEILQAVVDDLRQSEILKSQADIAQATIKLVSYTYPIPTVGLDDTRARIQNIMEQHDIFLLGRSGAWEYLNMDGVLCKVKDLLGKKFL
jgi:protoporphyrinogen oxidase